MKTKKLLCVLLCVVISACVFTSCTTSGSKAQKKYDSLVPSESVNYDELIPIYEFAGIYANDAYTIVAEQESDQIMTFTVTTNDNDGKGYEWQMMGYFSDQTYRVNYTESVKYSVTFDKNGKEIGREKEYENGSGRMQFTEKNELFWEDNNEVLDGNNELKRTNDKAD